MVLEFRVQNNPGKSLKYACSDLIPYNSDLYRFGVGSYPLYFRKHSKNSLMCLPKEMNHKITLEAWKHFKSSQPLELRFCRTYQYCFSSGILVLESWPWLILPGGSCNQSALLEKLRQDCGYSWMVLQYVPHEHSLAGLPRQSLPGHWGHSAQRVIMCLTEAEDFLCMCCIWAWVCFLSLGFVFLMRSVPPGLALLASTRQGWFLY